MAGSEDGPDRAWYLARMRKQLEAFDGVRVQIRHLKLTYLKQQARYLDDISELDAADLEYKAKRKVLSEKMLRACESYSALRGL
jgi:hypothetical protein